MLPKDGIPDDKSFIARPRLKPQTMRYSKAGRLHRFFNFSQFVKFPNRLLKDKHDFFI